MATVSRTDTENLKDDLATKAEQARDALTRTTSHASEMLSDRIGQAANKLRERLPADGRLGQAAESVASRLEQGGQYLRDRDFSGIGNDLTDIVRRNPMRASLVGLGLGILVGRALVNRRAARV